MKKHVMKFLRDEEGLTIVEYAVAAGLIAAAVVVAFGILGDTVLGVINTLIAALNGEGLTA
jgi:pilus assembly protein Flp/PilA